MTKHLKMNRISWRVTFINLSIMVLVIAIITAVTITVISGITEEASSRFAYIHSLESTGNFMTHIQGDLSLLRMAANSTAVREWFANEGDMDKKLAAFNEMQNFTPILQSNEFFFGIVGSYSEYLVHADTSFDDFMPHGFLTHDDSMDAWFFDLIESGRNYLFNIDVDRLAQRWRIWINYIVVHEGRVVGVICTSFRIDDVLLGMFGQYEAGYISGRVIDSNGFIHIGSDVPVHYQYLQDELIHIGAFHPELAPVITSFINRSGRFFTADTPFEVVPISDRVYDFAAIAPIRNSDWMIITLFNSAALFNIDDMIPLVVAIISGISLYMVSIILVMRRYVLKPLVNLTKSVSGLSGTEQGSIFGVGRKDEIGDLSETIQTMMRAVKEGMEKEHEAISRQVQIYDANPIPSSLWSPNFAPQDCNEAMVKLLGMSGKEDFLTKFAEFNPDMQAGGLTTVEKINSVATEIFEKGICRYDWIFKHANGELIPGECVGVRVDLKDTQFLSVHFQDMRPFIAAMEKEQELREHVQKEKQRVEVIEESNNAKSKFLARMSHEIRTPISAVMGISEIQLRGHDLPLQTEEAFTMINNSANMLLGIVNDILDLSKIEAGKMELIGEEYDVAGMINDVTHLILANAEAKELGFNVYVDENLPVKLVGDTLRIRQVTNNLLSNAIKYTEVGMVRLDIECDRENADMGSIILVISISDTGLGMTKEQVAALNNHDDYFRLHEREKRNISGTGLGMPIVYNLIQMMGADMNITSEANKGTDVVVRIPQKIADDTVLGRKTAIQLQNFETDNDALTKKFKFTPEPMPYGKVLVVDDVPANLYVAQGLLEFYEITVEICVSGFDVIELIKQGNVYDIIFTDNMMPGMDGTELMQTLKGMGYTSPIIVLTASALFGQVEQFIDDGFDGFLSKPIQTDQLHSILVKYIRDKQSPEAIRAARAKSISEQSLLEYHNDKNLLKILRSDFVRNYKDAFTKLKATISSGDTDAAHLQVHTIKGFAGLIHATALAEAAEEIEEVLEEGEIPTESALATFGRELTDVLASIG